MSEVCLVFSDSWEVRRQHIRLENVIGVDSNLFHHFLKLQDVKRVRIFVVQALVANCSRLFFHCIDRLAANEAELALSVALYFHLLLERLLKDRYCAWYVSRRRESESFARLVINASFLEALVRVAAQPRGFEPRIHLDL